MSAPSRSFAIKPFNFLLVCNVVLGLGIRRVAYLQWLHTLTLFAAQSAVLHTAPCLHTFCTFLHCRAQLQTACILGRGTRGRGRGRKPIREKFSAPSYHTKYASEPIIASLMRLTYSCCCCLLIRTQRFTGNRNQMSYSH